MQKAYFWIHKTVLDCINRSHVLIVGLGWGLLSRTGQQYFMQIGFIVLVGLACKNAILIVEFARQEMLSGKGRIEAAANPDDLVCFHSWCVTVSDR
jgi:hypothetical protein